MKHYWATVSALAVFMALMPARVATPYVDALGFGLAVFAALCAVFHAIQERKGADQ
jgi:hypothetical protein